MHSGGPEQEVDYNHRGFRRGRTRPIPNVPTSESFLYVKFHLNFPALCHFSAESHLFSLQSHPFEHKSSLTVIKLERLSIYLVVIQL